MCKRLLITIGICAFVAAVACSSIPSEDENEAATSLHASRAGEQPASSLGATADKKKLFNRFSEQVRDIGKSAGEGAKKVAGSAKPVLSNLKADSKDAYEMLKSNPHVQKTVDRVRPHVEKVKPHLDSALDRGSKIVSKVPILKKFGKNNTNVNGGAAGPAGSAPEVAPVAGESAAEEEHEAAAAVAGDEEHVAEAAHEEDKVEA